MAYDVNTPLSEPIEIRLVDGWGNKSTYLGSLNDDGVTVHHSWQGDHGYGEAMTNARNRNPLDYPRKAVPGWQAEVLAFFEASLKDVLEVR